MIVIAKIIQFNTKKIVDSNNWFLRLFDKTMSRRYHSLNYDWTFLSQNSCSNATIFLAHRNRIRIDFDFEFQQIDNENATKLSRFQLTNCNFIMREIKFFVYDLIVIQNRVNDKIILLLRFIERQFDEFRFVSKRKHAFFFIDRFAWSRTIRKKKIALWTTKLSHEYRKNDESWNKFF